ncbi:MAG: endonuclease/exonuclease/phosphatase family protein [Paracoccaceae bacterium]
MIIDIVIWAAVATVAGLTVLPSSRLSHGFVRGGDFPRQQLLAVALVLVPVVWFAALPGQVFAWILLAGVLGIQGFHIGRYLPVWRSQSVKPGPGDDLDEGRMISLLAANVKLSNRDYSHLVDLARERQPNIVMALETDQAWCDALEDLADIYPYRYACPLDTGYGMMILSHYEIADAQFQERVVEKVPSLSGIITLPSGDRFRLHVVHPEPPVPNHSTEGRDAELAHVAFEVRDETLPVIVSGDLNDVAWSITTRRFQKISRLLDPRVGRGFYNTFSARSVLMRWPLDHLFHSRHFRIVDMARWPDIMSDHFPMYFKLLLTPVEKVDEMPDKADAEEKAEAKEMIDKEQAEDREAIGSDWEDEEEKS